MMPNRIQKLLFSEYSDFEDMVLVESPFAEITRDGDGIRQVHLGLTPRNLVVAADVIRPVDEVETLQWAGVDPEIESFELVSVFPVELVNLSVFRRSRHTLKAHFCNKKIKFYELGGGDRKVLWRLWCERVHFLRGRVEASSRSETSVSSSTSASTAYVVSSCLSVADDGRPQLWERYCSTQQVTARRWDDRNLYLGSRFEVTPLGPLLPSSSSEGPSWTRSHRSPIACQCGPKSAEACNIPGADCGCNTAVGAGGGGGGGGGGACGVPRAAQRQRRRRGRRQGDGGGDGGGSGRTGAAPLPPGGAQRGRGGRRGPKRWHLINRFGQGVSENCGIGLWLDEREYEIDEPWTKLREEAIERRRRTEFGAPCCGRPVGEVCSSVGGGVGGGFAGGGGGKGGVAASLQSLLPSDGARDVLALAEGGVEVWERGRRRGHRHRREAGEPRRHWRRFALAPRPLFLRGVGPWAAQPGDACAAWGRRRALSAAAVLRQPLEAELCPPLPRAQLSASASCDAIIAAPPELELPRRRLRHRRRLSTSLSRLSAMRAAAAPPLLFWTARYWYRPYPRRATYQRLQRLLATLRSLHERMAMEEERASSLGAPSRLEGVKSPSPATRPSPAPRPSARPLAPSPARSSINLRMLLPVDGEGNCGDLQTLRRCLRPRHELSVWPFDSSTLAEQLTLIDKELLLQVPCEELRSVCRRRNSKAAPRLRALLAFAHRVACLVASEVLRVDSQRVRARLISRFIGVANKCHRMQNFQSCHSVLAGLQSVPIHRLAKTWAYMRWKHASRYSLFERLCRKYRDPRMPSYQRTFHQAKLQPPFMPFIGDIFTHLFGYLPETMNPYKEFYLPTCENRILCSLFTSSLTPGCISTGRSSSAGHDLCKIEVQHKCINKCEKNTEDNNTVSKRYNVFDNCSCIDLESLTLSELSFIFLCEATTFLKECQQAVQKYAINQNLHTREYLLKARYQEDFDNYVRSVILEDKQIYN